MFDVVIVCDPPEDFYTPLIRPHYILGAYLDGIGRQFSGGGREHPEGAEDLGTTYKDTGKGGSHPKGSRDVI